MDTRKQESSYHSIIAEKIHQFERSASYSYIHFKKIFREDQELRECVIF